MSADQIGWVWTAGVILFSALAAAFWLLSATSKVSTPGTGPNDFREIIGDGPGEYSLTISGVDVVATAALQTKWNTRAALAACGAAVCQLFQALPWAKIIG